GRKWDMKLEWAREGEGTATPSGWETNSPPFMNPDEIELFSAFLIKLGNSPFGGKGDFTGIHQNYDVTPRGEKAEAGLVARTIANFILMHEQFVPAIFKALEVERYGGYENVFMRPYLFDHPEYLTLMSTTDPAKLTPALIQKWQDQFMRREADIQIENHFDEGPKKEAAKLDWKNGRMNWKARTVKIKWHDKIERILLESRIFDHKPDQPWIAIKGTLLFEAMLNRSYQLAKEGKVFKLDVPFRKKNETVPAYWERIQDNPKMSMDAMIEALAITDKGAIGVLANRDFKTEKNFAAGTKESYGFEVEFFSPSVVTALLPNDGKMMAKWNKAGVSERMDILAKAGVAFDNKYTDHKYTTFSAGFRLDIDKYPYMEIRPHLEESGRLEILSNGREISEISDLAKKALEIKKVVHNGEGNPVDYPISFHFHAFIPASMISFTPEEADKFMRFMERLSLYMSVADYAEVKGNRAPHRLDSWSLDRYSPKELGEMRDHLLGKIKLSNSAQKYHNIGFRPVDNGIDFEVRAAGSDVGYGTAVLQMVVNAVKNKDFGPMNAWLGESFFMEPRHYANASEYQRYTLADALAKAGYKLTTAERNLVQKLQFEIYKPSMSSYMYFPEGSTPDSAPASDLDPKYLRTNFETNIALPLQPWEQQTFISNKEKKQIADQRAEYLKKVYALVKRMGKDSSVKFVSEQANFLYLCDYLERSTVPGIPKIMKGAEADRQKQVLENLVYEIRGLVVDFASDTRIDNVMARSLSAKKVPDALLSNAPIAISNTTTVVPEILSLESGLKKVQIKAQSCSATIIGKTGS
ncbi:MAG: hypothetical protein V4692_14020, partial [Bdellovibrionota bacterium]